MLLLMKDQTFYNIENNKLKPLSDFHDVESFQFRYQNSDFIESMLTKGINLVTYDDKWYNEVLKVLPKDVHDIEISKDVFWPKLSIYIRGAELKTSKRNGSKVAHFCTQFNYDTNWPSIKREGSVVVADKPKLTLTTVCDYIANYNKAKKVAEVEINKPFEEIDISTYIKSFDIQKQCLENYVNSLKFTVVPKK